MSLKYCQFCTYITITLPDICIYY